MTAYKGPAGATGPPGPALTNRGRRYLAAAGVDTGYATPDAASLRPTSTQLMRFEAWILPTTWPTAATQQLLAKWDAVPNHRSYQWGLSTLANKILTLQISTNGTLVTTLNSTRFDNAITALNSNLAYAVRTDYLPDDGTGNYTISHYLGSYNADGTTTYQLISSATGVSLVPHGNAGELQVAQNVAGTTAYTGRLYQASLLIAGVLVAHFDARGASDPPATFTDTATPAKVWTPMASAALLPDEVSTFDMRPKTVDPGVLVPAAAAPATPADPDYDTAIYHAHYYATDPSTFGTNVDSADDKAAIDAAITAAKIALYSGKSRGGVVRIHGLVRLPTSIVLPDWVSLDGGASARARIQPGSGFDVTTPLVQWGDGLGSPSFSSSLTHLTLDGLSLVQTIVTSNQIQQLCATDDLSISGWTQKGMALLGTGGGVQDITLRNIKFSGPLAGWDCAIELTNVSGQVLLDSITGDAQSQGAAFMRIIGGQSTTIIAPHMENAVDGIQLDLGAKATIIGSVGSSDVTNHIHALATHTGHYLIQMANKNSGTNNLVDGARSITNTNSVMVLNADGVALA